MLEGMKKLKGNFRLDKADKSYIIDISNVPELRMWLRYVYIEIGWRMS